MKTAYAMLIMALCLNLATYATGEAGIFTGATPLTPFNATQESNKFNGTSIITDITHSQDPTGGTDYVNVGLGIFGSFISGIVLGFPTWVFSIPYVPDYVGWMLVIVFGFIYATFIIEFASGRNISGDQ